MSYDEYDEYVSESEVDQRIVGIYAKRRSLCIPWLRIGDYSIRKGDLIRIRVKGYREGYVHGVFKCWNPVYSWLIIDTETDTLFLKLSEVRYIEKTKEEEKKEESNETKKKKRKKSKD